MNLYPCQWFDYIVIIKMELWKERNTQNAPMYLEHFICILKQLKWADGTINQRLTSYLNHLTLIFFYSSLCVVITYATYKDSIPWISFIVISCLGVIHFQDSCNSDFRSSFQVTRKWFVIQTYFCHNYKDYVLDIMCALCTCSVHVFRKYLRVSTWLFILNLKNTYLKIPKIKNLVF